MKLTYDNMVTFMQDYFPVFSNLGQDPATVHRMNTLTHLVEGEPSQGSPDPSGEAM